MVSGLIFTISFRSTRTPVERRESECAVGTLEERIASVDLLRRESLRSLLPCRDEIEVLAVVTRSAEDALATVPAIDHMEERVRCLNARWPAQRSPA